MKTSHFQPHPFRQLGLTRWCLSFALVIALSGCCRIFWRPGCPPRILTQPQSQTVKKGTPVTFSVSVSPLPAFYQWQLNGTNIPSANASSYSIPSANFSDVGAYRVLVWGSPTNTSQTAFLSVYDTIPNGGVLSYPIGYFAASTYTCDTGGTFERGYVATNPDGSLGLFYGPNVTTQTGLFKNTANLPRLTVDTFHIDNGTADTGLRLRNNFGNLATAICNDNAPTGGDPRQTDPKQSRFDFNLATGKSYRLTLLYKDIPGPPTSGKITFNWEYKP